MTHFTIPISMSDLDQIEIDGANARLNDLDIWLNPWALGTPEWLSWDWGYTIAGDWL